MDHHIIHRFGAWSAYAVCCIFVSLQFILQGIIAFMIPELKAHFGTDSNAISWLASSFYITYIFLQIPAGFLVGIFGVKRLTIASCLIVGIACFIFAKSSSYHEAMAARMLMGLGSAPGIVCLMEVISSRFSLRTAVILIGFMEAVGMLSVAVSDHTIPQAINSIGWSNVCLIFSVLLFILALKCLILVPEKHITKEEDNEDDALAHLSTQEVLSNTPIPFDEESVAVVDTLPKKRSTAAYLGTILDIRVWLIGLYSGALFAILNAFAAMWAIPFFQIATQECNRACSAELAGYIFTFAAIGASILNLIASRLKNYNILMLLSSFLVLTIFGILMFKTQLILGHLPLVMMALGFFTGAYLLPFVIIKEWSFPPNGRAVAVGLVNMLSVIIGALIIQPAIGWHISQVKIPSITQYQQGFFIIVVDLAIAFAIALYIHFRRDEILSPTPPSPMPGKKMSPALKKEMESAVVAQSKE